MNTIQNIPASEPVESIEKQFRQLEAEWDRDTAALSNPVQIMSHLAMRSIIALGEPVVPIILRQLEAGPSLLVWALPEIVGKKPELEGNVSTMTRGWLQWGREQGLL